MRAWRGADGDRAPSPKTTAVDIPLVLLQAVVQYDEPGAGKSVPGQPFSLKKNPGL
jgi:hypothetical protein